KLLCIGLFTDGPGCSEAWMQGVELQDGKFYVYVPFLVYAQSDVDIGEVPYQLSFDSHPNAVVVKEVNIRGTIRRGQSQEGYVVYELPEREVDYELHKRLFRSIGEVKLNANLSNTVFERPEPSTVGRSYAVSTSTTLPRTEQMLQDTQFVLEQGINVAFAAEAGYAVAIETGSSLRGALAFLYHLARSQKSTPPTSVEDVAEKVSQKGIAAFEEKVRETRGEIDEDVFGDGVVRTVGPTIIRQT
ncbi:MAG TPA: hypothetical protein VKA37_04045, partial [Halobacteriales archaeon]|nr:hypothetical protein [Halobacteriales archaeon]